MGQGGASASLALVCLSSRAVIALASSYLPASVAMAWALPATLIPSSARPTMV